MTNKIIIFFLIFLTSFNLFAEETPDYEYVNQGQCVKRNGFLFSEEGMANLYVSIDEKIKLAVLDKQKEVNLCKVNLENCTKLKETELRIQKEMFERQLTIKQDAIDAYKSEAFWNGVKAVGGTVIGIGVGILFAKYIIK